MKGVLGWPGVLQVPCTHNSPFYPYLQKRKFYWITGGFFTDLRSTQGFFTQTQDFSSKTYRVYHFPSKFKVKMNLILCAFPKAEMAVHCDKSHIFDSEKVHKVTIPVGGFNNRSCCTIFSKSWVSWFHIINMSFANVITQSQGVLERLFTEMAGGSFGWWSFALFRNNKKVMGKVIESLGSWG